MEKIGFNMKEASEMVGLSKMALHTEIKKGNLKTSRIGSRHIITRKQIDEWLEQSVGKTK